MQGKVFSPEEKERMVQMLYKTGMISEPTSSISVNHNNGKMNVSLRGKGTELMADISVVIVRLLENMAGDDLDEKLFILKIMVDRIEQYLKGELSNERD